jgi:hypothetical protein
MNVNYDIINGKKYKKCKENQLRNPITRRCINKDKKTAKDLLILNEKYYPKYLLKYIKVKVKKTNISKTPINDHDKRIYIYKKISENITKNIIINDNIIIKNKIDYGVDGNLYLSYLKKYPKYYFISKIVLDNKKSENEIIYLKMVSEAVINNRCPHFPILYGNNDLRMKDEDLKILPKLLKVDNNNNYKIFLSEYVDGNLKIFLSNMDKSDKIYLNTLTQIYLSLMFFYKETKSFHNNSTWDNFLYKKINTGGYYHYIIMGKDYYLENLGYLWMISDYDKCVEFNKSIDKNIMIKIDFERIIYSFLPSYYNGIINEKNYKLSQKFVIDILKILNDVKYYSELYTSSGMKIYITKIMNSLVKYGFLKTSINSLLIINKTPYKFNIK